MNLPEIELSKDSPSGQLHNDGDDSGSTMNHNFELSQMGFPAVAIESETNQTTSPVNDEAIPHADLVKQILELKESIHSMKKTKNDMDSWFTPSKRKLDT